jgi:hypothetical protein
MLLFRGLVLYVIFTTNSPPILIILIVQLLGNTLLQYLKYKFKINNDIFSDREDNFTILNFILSLILVTLSHCIFIFKFDIPFKFEYNVICGARDGNPIFSDISHKVTTRQIYSNIVQELTLNIESPVNGSLLSQPLINYNNIMPISQLIEMANNDYTFKFVKLNRELGMSLPNFLHIIDDLIKNSVVYIPTNFLYKHTSHEDLLLARIFQRSNIPKHPTLAEFLEMIYPSTHYISNINAVFGQDILMDNMCTIKRINSDIETNCY